MTSKRINRLGYNFTTESACYDLLLKLQICAGQVQMLKSTRIDKDYCSIGSSCIIMARLEVHIWIRRQQLFLPHT